MITRRQLIAVPAVAAIWPKPLFAKSYEPGITSIIDRFHKNDFDAQQVKNAGVIAVIHKATEGAGIPDRKYHDRKRSAKALGLLWGSYHFATDEPVDQQLRHYLEYTSIEDDEVICLDFEDNKGHEMTQADAHVFIKGVHDATGRYPMLYGGHWLREQVGHRPDAVFANCPLWYRRYASQPLELPTQIWPTYTLWQFTDGKKDYHGPTETVKGLVDDRNHFQGIEAQLKAAWPFTRRSA